MSIRAVFPDCDGLLVNTEPVGVQAAKSVCEEFGIRLEPGEAETKISCPDEAWYKDLVARKGVSHSVKDLLARHFEFYPRYYPDVEIFPGAAELLRELKDIGVPIGLVSGSRRFQIELVLKRLKFERFFDVLVTHEDMVVDGTPRSKPDPYPYTLALQKLNELLQPNPPISPEECAVLEDGLSGITSGLRARMHVIGVINAGVPDLSHCGADCIVPNLEVLRTWGFETWLEKLTIW